MQIITNCKIWSQSTLAISNGTYLSFLVSRTCLNLGIVQSSKKNSWRNCGFSTQIWQTPMFIAIWYTVCIAFIFVRGMIVIDWHVIYKYLYRKTFLINQMENSSEVKDIQRLPTLGGAIKNKNDNMIQLIFLKKKKKMLFSSFLLSCRCHWFHNWRYTINLIP